MDVVKRNIEALRGQVEIRSEKGKGSVFSIRLPLTLAIIDGMIVRVGSERYIIPTLSIVRSIQPSRKEIRTVSGRGEMLSLPGSPLLPLFRLDRLFKTGVTDKDLTESLVVVVEDDGRQVGIVLDELVGQQQIVIKSLGETLQGTPGISGGAIMADGQVGLILDIGGLVKLADIVDDNDPAIDVVDTDDGASSPETDQDTKRVGEDGESSSLESHELATASSQA